MAVYSFKTILKNNYIEVPEKLNKLKNKKIQVKITDNNEQRKKILTLAKKKEILNKIKIKGELVDLKYRHYSFPRKETYYDRF